MLADEVIDVIGYILAGAIVGGLVLYLLRVNSRIAQIGIDSLAVLAYLGFFAEAASSVVKTLADDTVFMTQVHDVLLSPVFLISGGYLGPYGLCFLLSLVRGR
ncbi:hypothetical protein ACFPYJ_02955 [Paenibacillus solisilvae]|uniref:Uncharacterized protein n=1 Tax=Paenibacillus solisilvae TaxID=2486751 RepID=A0ABW0VQC6_9BACL